MYLEITGCEQANIQPPFAAGPPPEFRLAFKSDNEPWPPMQNWTPFENGLAKKLDMDPQTNATISSQIFQYGVSQREIFFPLRTNGSYPFQCLTAWPGSKLAGMVAENYKLGLNNEDTTGAIEFVRIGPLIFDQEKFITEYDQITPEGYTSKHRSYRLFAHFTLDAGIYGVPSQGLEKDVIVYFDLPNQVWKIASMTPWKLPSQ
jgi:hypothetical protein